MLWENKEVNRSWDEPSDENWALILSLSSVLQDCEQGTQLGHAWAPEPTENLMKWFDGSRSVVIC